MKSAIIAGVTEVVCFSIQSIIDILNMICRCCCFSFPTFTQCTDTDGVLNHSEQQQQDMLTVVVVLCFVTAS